MIETFRGIWRFAGEEQRNIRRSVIACFFNAVFHMFEIAAIYYTILALLDGKTGPATAWQALGLLAVSILGSAVTKYFSQLQQTHAGYFMAANKRVAIGQRMKSVPMGTSTTTAWESSPGSAPLYWTMWRLWPPWCW